MLVYGCKWTPSWQLLKLGTLSTCGRFPAEAKGGYETVASGGAKWDYIMGIPRLAG